MLQCADFFSSGEKKYVAVCRFFPNLQILKTVTATLIVFQANERKTHEFLAFSFKYMNHFIA